MAKLAETVLTVSLEPIFTEDASNDPFMVEFVRTGRSRLIVEGDDAVVAVLHAQAVAAVERLRELQA